MSMASRRNTSTCSMRKYAFMSLLLGRKKLMSDIEVSRKTFKKRETHQQKHRPYLVLGAQMISPL
jgi:hypothetical protein